MCTVFTEFWPWVGLALLVYMVCDTTVEVVKALRPAPCDCPDSELED